MARPLIADRWPLPQPPPSRCPGTSDGFSLVELLIGSAILGVVVGGITLLLVSELKSSRQTLRAIGGTEASAQAVSLMREEISEASNILITSTPPTGCTTAPSFVLEGPGDAWRIAYGVRARSNSEATAWFGPSVLVRCGLPYNTSGSLDTSGSVAETVVADRVPSSGGLVVKSTGGTAGGATGNLIRDLAITLTRQADSGVTVPTTFSARIGVNRLYGTTDRLTAADCPADADNTCDEGTDDIQHFWPPQGVSTVDGDTAKENVIYFQKNRSGYTISNPCTNATCRVTEISPPPGEDALDVTITYGDLLVFADQELRL